MCQVGMHLYTLRQRLQLWLCQMLSITCARGEGSKAGAGARTGAWTRTGARAGPGARAGSNADEGRLKCRHTDLAHARACTRTRTRTRTTLLPPQISSSYDTTASAAPVKRIKIMVSAFGATDFPTSAGADATETCSDIAVRNFEPTPSVDTAIPLVYLYLPV